MQQISGRCSIQVKDHAYREKTSPPQASLVDFLQINYQKKN